MITRACVQCGREYQTFASRKPKYCSNKCVGTANVKGTIVQCEQCGTDIWSRPSEPRQYCSKSCAQTARMLTRANPATRRDITGERNPMYGKGLRGPENAMYGRRRELAPRWKGGRKLRKDGYVLVVVPDEYPSPSYTTAGGTKYVLEHRRVMEHALGRHLKPDEVVHHRDENPSNNVLENLELLASQAEHTTRHRGRPRRS